jgi:hypothetical protein
MSGFDFRRYQIFWEIIGLEGGPLSLVNSIEELLRRKSSGSGLEIREYGHRDPSRWPRGTLYPQKLALTSPTSGGRPVGIVRSRTQATEFSLVEFSFLVQRQLYLLHWPARTIPFSALCISPQSVFLPWNERPSFTHAATEATAVNQSPEAYGVCRKQ